MDQQPTTTDQHRPPSGRSSTPTRAPRPSRTPSWCPSPTSTASPSAFGLRLPVALTAAAWADCVAWDEDAQSANAAAGQDETGRLGDVLALACIAAQTSAGSDRKDFDLLRVPVARPRTSPELTRLSLHIGPGDDSRPVVTILRPDED